MLLQLFGILTPIKISLTSINCPGSQATVEKYSQYIKLFVNLSSIGTLNLLEEKSSRVMRDPLKHTLPAECEEKK